MLPRLIITPGEPAGIGAEILIKAVDQGAEGLIAIDDPARLEALAQKINANITLKAISNLDEASALPPSTLAVMPTAWATPPTLGKPDKANAPIVIDAIKQAVELAKEGKVLGVVTNPIQKSTLYEAGFDSPGHTEYLAKLDGKKAHPVMMLCSAQLRVIPLTIHIPLAEVAGSITASLIEKTATILNDSLRGDFNIKEPRIAIAGLNPHAGEDGHLGEEEAKIITPAINQLQQNGINIKGPYSADALFTEEHRKRYDAIIASYHDQALIPLKALDFHHAVNTTLGLSFIRTSPDHGTALDIADKFIANPASLMEAISLAFEMAKNRQKKR